MGVPELLRGIVERTVRDANSMDEVVAAEALDWLLTPWGRAIRGTAYPDYRDFIAMCRRIAKDRRSHHE